MIRERSFADVLQDLREETRTAEDVVDAVGLLKGKTYAREVAACLLNSFGRDPTLTRVLIRAAGKSDCRELHDVLAQRLIDDEGECFAFELIDALGQTGNQEYAAAIIPFLDSADDSIQSTAAHSLGMLKSPIAVLPLLKQYRRPRQKKQMKVRLLEALKQIFGSHKRNSLSMDLYLSSSPHKVQEEIRAAI